MTTKETTNVSICDCDQRSTIDEPRKPIVATCNGCGLQWCDRCDPTPSALCHRCHGRGFTFAKVGQVFTDIMREDFTRPMPWGVATVCTDWHGGQSSMFYAVSSTGALTPGSLARVRTEEDFLGWVADHYGLLASEAMVDARQADESGQTEGDVIALKAIETYADAVAECAQSWLDWLEGETTDEPTTAELSLAWDALESAIEEAMEFGLFIGFGMFEDHDREEA